MSRITLYLISLLVLLTSQSAVFAQDTFNGTASPSPQIISSNGDYLVCGATRWTDILIFILGNYFAHAATIKNPPGLTTLPSIWNFILAISFPTYGLHRGIQAIMSRAIFADTELQTAARPGALCMVVERPRERLKSSSN
jgi:hypothetical protein